MKYSRTDNLFNKFDLLYELINKFGSLCFYCKKPLSSHGKGEEKIQIDHLNQLLDENFDDFSNLVIACGRCNRAKSNHNPKVWLESLKAKRDLMKAELSRIKTIINSLEEI